MKGLDRNAIIGFILIGVILFTYMYLNRPTEEERLKKQQEALKKQQEQDQKKKDTLTYKKDVVQEVPDSVKKRQQLETFGKLAPLTQGKSRIVTIENELLRLSFDTKGANLMRAELKGFKTYNQTALVLFEGKDNKTYFNFGLQNGQLLNTQDLYFTPSGDTTMKVTGTNQSKVVFRAALDNNNYLEQSYSLQGNSYVVAMNFAVKGMKEVLSNNNSYELNFQTSMLATERAEDLEDSRTNSGLYYNWAEDVDHLSLTSKDVESETQNGSIYWVSHKVKYFSAALIPGTPTLGMKVTSSVNENNAKVVKSYASRLTVGYNPNGENNHSFRYYLGPNDYYQLKAVAKSGAAGFHKQLGLGWFVFKYVNMYIIIPLFSLFEGITGSYGIVIILLSLAIRLILLPLNWKSYTSGAKMRILSPQLEPIKEKYKEDPTKQQQETMKFYRSAGVNPLGGCVPLLLQLPILFAVLQFFPQAIQFRQQNFLWANDLSTYDSILNFGFKIPFYGDHVSLFTLLMTASTLVYTFMTNKTQTNAQFKQMVWISYLMPIIFLGYFNSVSAALSFYYFMSTTLSIVQQEAIKRSVDEKKLLQKIQNNQQKSAKQPEVKSAFQRRLEDMQKRQADKAKVVNNKKKK